jgi:multidrug efflux pump subunit AcrA (membrane-fusion protein)
VAAARGTGTYQAEVRIDAAGRTLASGLVGTVEVEPAAGPTLPLVPVEAVVEADGDSGTVFTVSDDGTRARRRAVTIAFVRDGRAAVAAGLDGVDRVVTDGAAYLRDGAAVKQVGRAGTDVRASQASSPNESAEGTGSQP